MNNNKPMGKKRFKHLVEVLHVVLGNAFCFLRAQLLYLSPALIFQVCPKEQPVGWAAPLCCAPPQTLPSSSVPPQRVELSSWVVADLAQPIYQPLCIFLARFLFWAGLLSQAVLSGPCLPYRWIRSFMFSALTQTLIPLSVLGCLSQLV